MANLNVADPMVITTGPATLDPATGRAYGARFPQVTYPDMVGIQSRLLAALGVERLAMVAGPSAGGFQALEWAVRFPAMVERCAPVISAGRAHPWFGMVPMGIGIDCTWPG